MTFSMNAVGRRIMTAVRKGYMPIALATLAALAAQITMNFATTAVAYTMTSGSGLGSMSIVVIAVSHWFHAVHTGAISEIAIRADIGKPVDPLRVLVASLKNSLPVLLLTLVYSVGCVIGGVLLIIPGLFFATAFSIVVPVFIGERGNWIATFGRAFRLTEGHRWQIFAFWLVLGLTQYILSHAISGQAPLSELRALYPQIFSEFWPQDGTPLFQFSVYDQVARGLLSAITIVVLSVRVLVNTGIYLTLRSEKDASSDDALAQVFA